MLCAADAAYVVTLQGARVEGSDIRARANGEIILTTPQGTRTFYKGQYMRAVADKPASFDRARQLADQEKYDEAITLLEQIIKEYRYLEWDNQARAALPQVYAGKGDYVAAAKAYEDLFDAVPKSKESDELMWSYREVLLQAGQYSELEKELEDIIEDGARDAAARAQIMRGDIRKAQGQLEPAVLDYLRTMVLFEKQAEFQPEATFKAAEVLEELRDRRSKDLFRQVVENYPGSPYAAQARSRM
jgi:TolA-binding protein